MSLVAFKLFDQINVKTYIQQDKVCTKTETEQVRQQSVLQRHLKKICFLPVLPKPITVTIKAPEISALEQSAAKQLDC